MAELLEQKIKFLKIRRVTAPFRAWPTDAGIDFFVPEFDVDFIKDLKKKNQELFNTVPPGAYDNHGNLHIQGDCLAMTSQYPTGSVASGGLSYDGVHSGSISMVNNGNSVTWDLSDRNNTLIKFDEERGENYFILPPHSRVMIPSGIKCQMQNEGRALIAGNKSGVATKHGLVYGAQIVDYTYQGEIHLSLINTSTKNVRIYENMKILQFVETPIFTSEVETTEFSGSVIRNLQGEVVGEDECFFFKTETDRGAGGFGSTDKKENKKDKK